MNKFILFFLIAVLYITPLHHIMAAIAITPPSSFVGDGNQTGGTPGIINVKVVGEDPGTFYLKAYFYPSDNPKKRFGYVWNPNSNSWVSTWQSNAEQLQITTTGIEGWQGDISVKTDIEKSGYTGPGEYTLKVRAVSVSTTRTVEISAKVTITQPNATTQTSSQNTNTTTNTNQNLTFNQTVNNNTQTPAKTAENGSLPALTVYPTGIFINEILPNPKGADETDEWIELYNSNNIDVDLSGWQLQDRAGTITTYTIPSVTKIMAGGYLVFKRPDTKIMLNNDGDGVNLIDPNKKIVDSVGFLNAPLGQSYNKYNGDWSWSTTLTQSNKNIIASPVVIKKSTTPSTKAEKPANNSNIKAQDLTAGLSQPVSGTNPWPLFLIALGITIILAVAVLIIKFKLNNHVRT